MLSFRDPGLYYHQLGRLYKKGETFSYVLLRIAAGAFLIPHGLGKMSGMTVSGGFVGFLTKLGVPMSSVTAYAVVSVEVISGALIAIGLFTRVAALSAIGLLVGIIYLVHWDKGFMVNQGGYEYQMMWLLVLVYVFFRGSGRYSVDGLRGVQV